MADVQPSDVEHLGFHHELELWIGRLVSEWRKMKPPSPCYIILTYLVSQGILGIYPSGDVKVLLHTTT